jgi:hypothetical protein
LFLAQWHSHIPEDLNIYSLKSRMDIIHTELSHFGSIQGVNFIIVCSSSSFCEDHCKVLLLFIYWYICHSIHFVDSPLCTSLKFWIFWSQIENKKKMWYSAAFIPVERDLLLCNVLYLAAAESFISSLFTSILQHDDEMHLPQLKKSDIRE